MPPLLATFLTFALIVYLFRRDFRAEPKVSTALWIPVIWILITGSRAFSEWCAFFGLPLGGAISVEQGSPVDALVYYTLIGCGFWVIKQRRINLTEFIQNNRFLSFFLLFCFVAILWSDFPLVSLKR